MSSVAVCELEIPLQHLRLAARAWGNPCDPPMLALHGWLDNAASFDVLAPFLTGHYVVAVDFAGHGRSQHRGVDNWSPYVDYLGDIGEIVTWFGWQRFDLLGHSLGATLASFHAAIAPKRVQRLILIEGLGPIAAPPSSALDQLRFALAARAAFDTGRRRVFPTIEDAVEARRKVGELSRESVRLIVERGLQRVDDSDHAAGGYVWSSDARLKLPTPHRFTEEQIANVLPAIRAPTLLILAEPAAPYWPKDVVDGRIALVPDIEVVRMAGHHHLQMDDATAVASVIRDFLAKRRVQVAESEGQD
jgi:pimeloyl-ACP methyl ester carboxylesterase